ncbi:MAG: RNA polymerase-binding protein DksA [Pseudomonadota bacterium]
MQSIETKILLEPSRQTIQPSQPHAVLLRFHCDSGIDARLHFIGQVGGLMAQAKAKKTPSKTAPAKKATASATKTVKKAPAKATVKAPAKKAVKAPAKPVAKAAAKPAPKAKSAAKPAAKTTVKTPAKTSAPKAAPAAKPAAKPAVKTAAPKAEPPKNKAMTQKPAVKKTPAATGIQARETSPLDTFTNFTPYNLKKGENYMNDSQVDHFRKILAGWKQELMVKVDETVHHMQDESSNVPDPNDRATIESDFTMELRTRDRERKLIKKIEESIKTLDSGEYGYCENCGEEIGIRRLEARPTAQLCIDCKTLDEIREKHINR